MPWVGSLKAILFEKPRVARLRVVGEIQSWESLYRRWYKVIVQVWVMFFQR